MALDQARASIEEPGCCLADYQQLYQRLCVKIASIRSARDASVRAFNLHNQPVRRFHAT